MPGRLIRFSPWYCTLLPSLVNIKAPALATSMVLPPPMPTMPAGSPRRFRMSSRRPSISSVVGSSRLSMKTSSSSGPAGMRRMNSVLSSK